VCLVAINAAFDRHQHLNLALRKTSSFFQGVEGVEICLAAGDRIEKRVVRIERASGSRFKGIARKRSNRSPAREYFHSGELTSLGYGEQWNSRAVQPQRITEVTTPNVKNRTLKLTPQ